MKSVASGLATHLTGEVLTLATMWSVLRQDGTEFFFTDHDQDITHAGDTYLAASGFNASDVASGSDLQVDNLEIVSFMESPLITEEDLLAGLWDFARVRIFKLDWTNGGSSGTLFERYGRLGEVRLERGQFVAEMRGLTQALTRSIGRIAQPACDASLGDSRCTVDLEPLTVTGTIEGVNADGVTLYDSARTEDGPSGGIAITGITNANPGVVTTATDHGFTEGQVITISGVVGMAVVNVVTVAHNPSGNTFELSIDTTDTTDYPPYVSDGTVTPYGDSGYFDFGVITMTSGANEDLRMEVKSYVTGQITLALPFPYVVEVGDTYSMHPGCDKSLATCRDRFNNVVNFRGFPYLPGTDKLVQVGRHGQ